MAGSACVPACYQAWLGEQQQLNCPPPFPTHLPTHPSHTQLRQDVSAELRQTGADETNMLVRLEARLAVSADRLGMHAFHTVTHSHSRR